MFEFHWPWAFALLPLPVLLWWLRSRGREMQGGVLRLPHFQVLRGAWQHEAGTGRERWVALVAAMLVWVCLVAAGARPQWYGEPVSLPQSGRDLFMALDLSGSMKRTDLAGEKNLNRLAVVRAVAREFISARKGDRIGLILFGSRAYLQAPLTFDRATVRVLLDEAEIGLAGERTAIGDALAMAVKQMVDLPSPDRVLILLTDGANNAGRFAPQESAQLAAQAGIRVYTIGLGARRLIRRSLLGQREVRNTELDEATLRDIARVTGGRYFRATDAATLQQIAIDIDQLEPRVGAAALFRPVTEWYFVPLALALLLSMLQQLLGALGQRTVRA